MIELGAGFPTNLDLTDLLLLPVIKIKYQQPVTLPDYPHWISYIQAEGAPGSIDFLRAAGTLHKELGELASCYVRSILDVDVSLSDIHLIITTGSYNAHRDEGRARCVNIGLKNTSQAVTRVSSASHEWKSTVSKRVLEGHAYLLDTQLLHEVVADSDYVRRLMISINFNQTYNDLLRKWL